MTNVNTQYWKRVVAYFDRVEKGEERPTYDELLQRAQTIARHGQQANDRVAELESENERLKMDNFRLQYELSQARNGGWRL